MEIDSDRQRLISASAYNLTALAHELRLPRLNASVNPAEQWNALRQLAGTFCKAYPDAKMDVLHTNNNLSSVIFYQAGVQSTPHLRGSLQVRINETQHLFQRLEYAELGGVESGGRHVCVALLVELGTAVTSASDFSACCRPYPGLQANGDGYFYRQSNAVILVCVVDGLGHGEHAEIARQVAIHTLKESTNTRISDIFAQVHTALRKTRGAAMTLACVDLEAGVVEYGGVGNVELRLAPESSHFIPKAGVLGMGVFPRPVVARSEWQSDSMLVLYSDGISGRWSLADLRAVSQSSRMACHLLLRGYAKEKDDATVLVMRGG